jgi:LAS superfamily LD-carboxypeptidase LdcB
MIKSLVIETAELLGQSNQHIHYLSEHVGIHKHMIKEYQSLVTAAQKDGIDIEVASGFRSFERQRFIWNNKFSGKTVIKDKDNKPVDITSLSSDELMHAIMLYSALPGASRHHWGCDIDVYASNLLANDYQLKLEPWEYQASGPLEKLSLWLAQHAHKFGFYLPYEKYQGGVAAEPWHLSYASIANQYKQKLTSELLTTCFNRCNTEQKILGHDTIITHIDTVMSRYVNNINDVPDKCYNPRPQS